MTYINNLNGVIWNDVDGDGLNDDGAFIAGVTVRLYRDSNSNGQIDPGESLVGTTTTNAHGAYQFSGSSLRLKPGRYIVDVDNPSVGSRLPGAALTGGGTDPRPVHFSSFGQTIGNVNFGYQARGSVTGSIFNDLDGNGSRNGSETGLTNVQVQLKKADGSVLKTATTDAQGNYNFTEIAVGTYTVDVVDSTVQALLPGALQTAGVDPSAVTVGGGQTVSAGFDGYRTPSSPKLTVELGYEVASETPDLNSILSRRSLVDNLAQSIQLETQQAASNPAGFDGTLDGYKYYVQPKDNGLFTQTIKVNNGTGGGIAQTVEFTVEATNSSYIRLLQSGFSATIRNAHTNQVVNGSPSFTVSSDLDPATNIQKYRLTFTNVNLAANQYILLSAKSEIDQQAFDGANSNDITERGATFSLTDGPGVDWGTGKANNNFFFSRQNQVLDDRFSFSDGLSGSVGNGLPGSFAFSKFSNSTLKVDLSPSTPTLTTDPDVKWQSAETLSGLGVYNGIDTQGGGGATRSKSVFHETFSGNLDATFTTTSKTRSDSLLSSALTLAWLNPANLDATVDAYIAAQSAANKAAAYDLFINDLVDDGIFDKNYSSESIVFKPDGRLIEGSFARQGEFTQDAKSGEIVGTNLPTTFPIVVFPQGANAGETFSQFANRINALGASQGIQYRIDIAAPLPTNLTLQNFTGSNIALIVVPPGSTRLPLVNGNGNDNLNLSNTLIAAAASGTAGSYILGPQTGVNLSPDKNNGGDNITGSSGDDILFGGNGSDNFKGGRGNDVLSTGNGGDTLDGGLGNDRLTGGNGVDIFVLRRGEGRDQITDFTTSRGPKDKIGLGGGLQFGQLTRTGNEIRLGNEVLAVLDNVNTATLSASDFVTVV
jgi:Ca2+-binding RTX toxin-like protein